MKSVNDIGGENWGTVPMTQKEVPDWALLATALRAAVGERGAGLVSLHEQRRAREQMPYDRYHGLGYFELSLQAMYDILVEKDVLSAAEVEERIAALRTA